MAVSVRRSPDSASALMRSSLRSIPPHTTIEISRRPSMCDRYRAQHSSKVNPCALSPTRLDHDVRVLLQQVALDLATDLGRHAGSQKEGDVVQAASQPAHLPVDQRDLFGAGAEEQVVHAAVAVDERARGGRGDARDVSGHQRTVGLGHPAHLGGEEIAEVLERGDQERQVEDLHQRLHS